MTSRFPDDIDYAGRDVPTSRELEVLHFAALGLTNPEIGKVLFISTETVKSHLKHLRTKVKLKAQKRVSSKLELIIAAWELELLTIPSLDATKYRFLQYQRFQEQKQKDSQGSR